MLPTIDPTSAEHDLAGWQILLIFALLLLPVLATLFYYLVFLNLAEKWWSFRYKIFPKDIPLNIKTELVNHQSFYRDLPPELKYRYEQRLMVFLKSKKFTPKHMPAVTERMKILIAASAVQITLGLNRYRLKDFRDIHVFPDRYWHKYAGKSFKGHVSSRRGLICISWKHFEHGYDHPDDGINLGLHEMAHAVKLQLIRKDVNFRFLDKFEHWAKVGRKKLDTIRAGKNTLLRDYAGTNLDELFAVSVEYFFEQPEDFRDQLPELFQSMCDLLNQDPIKKELLNQKT